MRRTFNTIDVVVFGVGGVGDCIGDMILGGLCWFFSRGGYEREVGVFCSLHDI